jgi:F-type H+-transporting ATPase subunit epsilon
VAGRKTFELSLVTPEGAAYEGEAEMVIVPGAAGDVGVLARHAPLVATLKAGSVRVYRSIEPEEMDEYAIGPGFFKVERDRAIALVDDAVSASDIDYERAQRQLEAAQAELEAIESDDSSADRWQIEQRLRHAQNQLNVLGRG